MEKETNAYKYPNICEPWYLKNRDRNPNHLAKYDYIMNTWNNQNYDPLTGGYNNNFDTFNNTIYNINNLMVTIYPLSITAARPKDAIYICRYNS